MTVLIDSDILIEVAKGKDQNIVSRWKELSESDNRILCSPVTVAELWAGARAKEHEMLKNLFRVLTCVPIDAETGRQAGNYLHRFRKSHGLELGDAFVASAALMTSAALWTRNSKHYPMKDLKLF